MVFNEVTLFRMRKAKTHKYKISDYKAGGTHIYH
jgi:hypothetical protein